MSLHWSAKQYVGFEAERTRPARDLLMAVPPREVRSAIDLGCGPGNSTELIASRFPDARVTGIDSAADMIAAARSRLPDLSFEVADIVAWTYDGAGRADPAARADLIFANAALHWVSDHARLFPALVSKLAPGGCLAVQVPDNLDEPAQVLMRQVAHDGPWRQKLAGAELSRVRIESADWYYRLLRASCSRVDVWRTTYHHPLAGAGAIVEWFKGTGLLPYLAPLDAAERADYLGSYTQAVERAYPAVGATANATANATADGTVLLPFPRLFIVANRH